MAKIYAPNEEYNGISAGVRFCNGVGETDIPHIKEWFRNHGYIVEEGVREDNKEEPQKHPKKPAKKAGE